MSSITSLGVGSGLDLNGILGQLQEAEQQKLEPIQDSIETAETEITAYGKLKSALSELDSSVSQLSDASTFEGLTSNVEGGAVSAVTSNDAQPGRYDVSVGNLATAGSLVTERIADIASDESIVDGEQSLTFDVADGTIDPITIADGSSLEDIRDAVNAQSGGALNASIINDGEGNRLSVNATETGADASVLGTNFTDILSGDVVLEDSEVQQDGQDAQLNVNGVDISSSTNQVEDAIQGVTLNLNEANASSVVTVEQDVESITDSVAGFVENFNNTRGTVDELTAFDPETEQAAALSGDSAARSVESALRSAVSNSVGGDGFNALSEIGVSLQVDGTLSLDEDKLNDVVTNQPEAVSEFFTGSDSVMGMGEQLSNALDRAIGPSGRLDGAIDATESRASSLNDRLVTTEERITQTIDRYRTEFTQLDTMMSEMNQTGAYLSQQLAGMQQG
ncbi:MAG: flagellar hook-associated protein 2 [Halomonas sp. HL-48]|nr:flagellar filament capping protein FliD [Halomonas sp. HL-48]KPQ23326.1 MAG: flagellar hook-associated protein 2 [Halomonas sp. HL-48]